MKKFYIPYLVFAVLIIILFVLNISSASKKDNIQSQENTEHININVKTENENQKIERKAFYTVKEHNGEIFLYDDKFNIIEKLNIDFNSLREYDKTMFVKGIYVDNIEDVYLLIEDFSN